MKRLSAIPTLVITLLLLVSVLATPAQARQASGSIDGTVLDSPQPPPGGDDGSGLPNVLEGDPDELTGGNLSVTDPNKPMPSKLWQSFLSWIQQSTEKLLNSR
jgi:hypothetical protein